MNTSERARWLEARRTGIGGSDIAAILGLSPWKTALDVYLEKRGEVEDSVSDSDAVYWGNVLEAVVADEYAKRTGRKIQRINQIIRHPEYDWAIGSIDRAIVADGTRARIDRRTSRLLGADGVLECKTTSAFARAQWGRDEDDEAIPLHYQAQGMWYLAITGLPWCDFAALIGGQRFVIKRLMRDDEVIAQIFERAEDFWHRHVLAGVPPEPANARDVERLFPVDDGESIEADAELIAVYQAAREAREAMREAEAQYEAACERIKAALGPHSTLTLDGKPIVTWRAPKPARKTDWKALAATLSPELIEQFTREIPGSRRFILKDL